MMPPPCYIKASVSQGYTSTAIIRCVRRVHRCGCGHNAVQAYKVSQGELNALLQVHINGGQDLVNKNLVTWQNEASVFECGRPQQRFCWYWNCREWVILYTCIRMGRCSSNSGEAWDITEDAWAELTKVCSATGEGAWLREDCCNISEIFPS